jgi:phosphate transport system permease protein
MNNSEIKKNIAFRKMKDIVFRAAVILFSFIATLPLFLIFYFIFREGIHSINWSFFVNLPRPVGETGGGISNAIIGTLMLIVMACGMALPLGIFVGVYLAEYAVKSRFSYWVRLSVEVLQGIPSIVIGIIAYIWIVKPFGTFSAFSGSVALAVMMLPVMVRSTEETVKMVPHNLKEASLALGVPYYLTILKVIVPASLSGIVTGIIISIARVAGETAPLLFTAFGNPFMNINALKPVHSLPLVIFNYAISPYKDWHDLAWGASLVLIVFVLFMNIIAKIISRKWKVEF